MPYVKRDSNNKIKSVTKWDMEGFDRIEENDPEWIQYLSDKNESKIVEDARLAEIETSQESGGLRKITVQIAKDKIDLLFSGATTVALLRTACIKAFKLIVVFILK